MSHSTILADIDRLRSKLQLNPWLVRHFQRLLLNEPFLDEPRYRLPAQLPLQIEVDGTRRFLRPLCGDFLLEEVPAE
jgi:hypothetical protein